MGEGLSESVKQALEERIKNPLWGFIILAWFSFNWANLALLFMSDDPVKDRIKDILSQEDFYIHYLGYPIIVGVLLAIGSPYVQWLLSLTHQWASDRARNNIFQSKTKDYQDAIRLSELKVQSDRALEIEGAKIDASIKAEIERGKREGLITEELESRKNALADEVKNLKEVVSLEKETIKNITNEKERLQDVIVASYEILDEILQEKDTDSIKRLMEEIASLYTLGDFDMSSIRNAKKNKIVQKHASFVKYGTDEN